MSAQLGAAGVDLGALETAPVEEVIAETVEKSTESTDA